MYVANALVEQALQVSQAHSAPQQLERKNINIKLDKGDTLYTLCSIWHERKW